MIVVRRVFAPGCEDQLRKLVDAALVAHGIAIDGRTGSSCTLVVFAGFGEEVLATVRDSSRAGRDRVLALAGPGTRLRWDQSKDLLAQGASDALSWDECDDAVIAIGARINRWAVIDRVIEDAKLSELLVGRSPQWLALCRQLVEVSQFTDAPVLVAGETGTGKELVARQVHELGSRRKGELVVVDCTTIVAELSGSELFGHERGAFTGAVAARDGAFARAHGGTLFLDEIGELSLPLQAQLLRAVQEGTYKRVGGNEWRQVSFRLVCATNKDLSAAVDHGQFRRDLYYRLAGATLRTPALRERVEDILPLAKHFLAQTFRDRAQPHFSRAVENYLSTRSYPGNVRDLRQLVLRMAYRHCGEGPVTLSDVGENFDECAPAAPPSSLESWVRHALVAGSGLKDVAKAAEDVAIRVAIEESHTLREAALRLGISDRALQLRRALAREMDGAAPPSDPRETVGDVTSHMAAAIERPLLRQAL